MKAALAEWKKENSLLPEVAQSIKNMVDDWEALDNDALRAETIAQFLEDEDSSWTRGTFERALSFHLYNKKLYGAGDVQGFGLRAKQPGIFNGLASGNIARDTVPLLAQALRAEFAVAEPVVVPAPRG